MTKRIRDVFIADVHCHPFQEFNEWTPEGQSSRVLVTCAAIQEAVDLAVKHCATLWCLGDLLHSKQQVPAHVFAPLREALHRSPRVQLLVGNHERPDHYSDVNTLEWLAASDESRLRRVIGSETVLLDRGVLYFCLPYRKDPKGSLEWLQTTLADYATRLPDTPRILLGHGTVHGAKADNGSTLHNPNLPLEALLLPSFNLSFWGDIHKHQQIASNAWYVGALLQQNAGERTNPPGFIVLYEDFSWERVPVNAPQFVYAGTEVTIQTSDQGVTQFIKPSPEKVAAAVVADAPRLDMDTTSLHSMVKAYTEKYPPGSANITADHITQAVQACLKEATS